MSKLQLKLEYIFCGLISLICITINSKCSILYEFNDVSDVHCFITTARCMLRGDVLYRDVYEHKGPLHYFLYCIGLAATDRQLWGIWIIEVIFFSVFLYFSLKIIRLFCEKDYLNYVICALIGIMASGTRSFVAGGECEELCLPFVAMTIYFAILSLRENASVKTKRIAAIIAGICFGAVFWSKYTLVGAFAGYALAILIIGILKKDIKYILESAMFFLAGFLAISIPVIVYFAITGAFSDLWEVYFYNLIFKYSKTNLGTNGFIANARSVFKLWILLSVAGIVVSPKKQMNLYTKIMLVLIVVFELSGLAAGKLWGYSYEMIYAFAALGFVGLLGIINRLYCIGRIKILYDRISSQAVNRLKKELAEKPVLRKTVSRIRQDRRKTTCMVMALLLLYTLYFSYTISPCIESAKEKIEDFPVYQMSEMIKNKVPDDPVVLCYGSLEPGLYYALGSYPPDRFFCGCNLFTPEEMGYYEKYIETGIADYIVSSKEVEDLGNYGYELVYCAEYRSEEIKITPTTYYLYARNELADK